MMKTKTNSIKLLLFVSSVLFLPLNAQATGSGLMFEGQILKPDGAVLVDSNVTFKVQVRTPDPTGCVLYEEVQTLALVDGHFAVTLNDGTGTRTTGSFLLADSLSNRRAFNNPGLGCASGSSFTPSTADGRKVVISFKDSSMASFEEVPSLTINPSAYAFQAQQVGGFSADDLLRVERTGAQTVAPMLFNDYTKLVDLVAGTSNQYAKTNQLNGSNLPTLTAGQSLSWNGTSWSGTTPLLTEADPTVQAFAKASLPACTTGQVLSTTAGALQCVTDATGGGGTTLDATTTSKGIVQISTSGGLAVTSGVLGLADVATAGTFSKVNVDSKGRVVGSTALAETDVPTLTAAGKVSGSAITTGDISTSGNITAPSVSADYMYYKNANGGRVKLIAPASIANGSVVMLTLPGGTGATGQVLATDGTGNLSWTQQTTANGSNLGSGKIWVGDASNQAQPVAVVGDVTLSNTGAFTVTRLRGREVASTAPNSGQVLKANGAGNWEPSNFSIGDLKTSTGTQQFSNASCLASQTLSWSSLTDAFSCTNISVTASQVSGLGTAAARNFGTAAGNLVELDGAGKVAPGLLPASAVSQWVTNGSSIYYNGPIKIGSTGSCISSATNYLRFASGVIEFCDGTIWRPIITETASVVDNSSSTAISFSAGKFQSANNCQPFTVSGLMEGITYKLAILGTSGTCSFNTGATNHTNGSIPTGSKMIVTFERFGSEVFITSTVYN